MYCEQTFCFCVHTQGQTFGKVIRDFVDAYEPLKEYLDLYKTTVEGKKVYDECLEATHNYFPQYVIELKGMATGADVPFHKVRSKCVEKALKMSFSEYYDDAFYNK